MTGVLYRIAHFCVRRRFIVVGVWFVVAVALVKGRDLTLVEPRSVHKKLRDKAFARSVSREDIYKGAEELGVDLDEHIVFVREALLQIAADIGLAGATPGSPAAS